MRDPIAREFSPRLIERLWREEEYAFDSTRLRAIMLSRLERLGGIELRNGVAATRLSRGAVGIDVETSHGTTVTAPLVVSSVYSQINALHRASDLPLVPLQLEVTEMALVRTPPSFANVGVTVMDGPFFSMMPFPSRGLHTLSHVRYTPHERWVDTPAAPNDRPIPTTEELARDTTTFREMVADVRRYVPGLGALERVDSLREVKAVLAHDDRNDSRPILVRANDGLEGYICVMGGKIDNVNDVLLEISTIVSSGSTHHGVH
jgi:glycine/D-amino acid oxidase-like deaminating enzyme